MSGSNSLKEYLKKYENNVEDDKKKKKKKKKIKTKPDMKGVLVVDEDPVWQKPIQLEQEEDDESQDEEKPQIDEDIEVKRMKRLEQLKSQRPFGAISEDGSGWVSVSEEPAQKLTFVDPNSDISPPRKRRARNDTPSPDRDLEPSRTLPDSDISPPRKRRARNDTPSPEHVLEPSRSLLDSDISPPRRAPHRSSSSNNHPRASAPEDLSPPRKKREVSASDLSPPRKKPVKEAERPKTGLVSGKDIKEEIARTKEQDCLRTMSRAALGPAWHAPWKNYRVMSGHLGWVRSIAFDPSNRWFFTGSADRTIKMWDVASGKLQVTLTGHIEQVRGLAVSTRHTYMFSAGDDKQVKCWDLEQNKVIRSYHGHLSGVYCLALHPTIDVLLTGGRDSVCRVWDIRSKMQIHALSGHDNTVCSVFTRSTDPQVVTGSHDSTIKLWDLRYGKTMATLTHHKKSVRALAHHPIEDSFASASADSIKKLSLPRGEFVHNMLSQQKTIINAMALNEDGVLATGGDNGSLWFWDWKTGHCFQQSQTIVQPGSLDCEAGVYALSFDKTGSRLVTCEADKTIKMWKKDECF